MILHVIKSLSNQNGSERTIVRDVVPEEVAGNKDNTSIQLILHTGYQILLVFHL